MAIKVNKDNFETEVTGSKLPVLADFYSDGCIPCRQLSPLLAELAEQYAGKIKLIKINTVISTDLTAEYGVLSAPTLIFFKNGIEQSRTKGMLKKEALVNIIDKIIGGGKMTIAVADNRREYDEGLTVAQLIIAEKVENPEYVTVTVNEEFIKSEEFETTVLKDNDSVEFLYFMGGGR